MAIGALFGLSPIALILTGSDDQTACLWNLTDTILATFQGHTDSILTVVFSPNGETAFTGSSDGTIRRWNLENIKDSIFEHTINSLNIFLSL